MITRKKEKKRRREV